MAADSVGQIGLDLVVNKNEFDSQMLGIQNLAKKAGKALAAAFAVKKVFDFGKSCIADLLNQLKDSFTSGFWDAFGDTSVFDSIQSSIQSIKDSLGNIFTDSDVQTAALGFANTLARSLGQVTGSVASIGATIADNLLGGISRYLEQRKERIKDYIVQMFNIGSRIAEITGNFSSALAIIFSSLRSDGAVQFTSDIIGIFPKLMGITELAGNIAADILDVLTAPFIENADYIRDTVEDTFSAIEPIYGAIRSLVETTFAKIGEGL